MRSSRWTPSLVPAGDDDTFYLVLDDFGRHGRAWRETDPETADLETIISNMIRGEYRDPIRVAGFNISEGWVRDVSEDVADEITQRCNGQGAEIPPHLGDFVERHANRDDRAQLRLV